MKRSAPAFLACLVVAMSCSDDRFTGNSVETESDIAARSFSVDSLLSDWNRPVDSLTVATIRLDSRNFDFSKTRSDGKDVRVQRGDGSQVPFQLQVWDVAARIGRLRVRIDSSLLHERDSIVLRWGDTAVAGRTDSVATWKGIGSAQKKALNSVLVDDFEGRSFATKLPTAPSWETVVSDSAELHGLSRDSAGAGRTGKALHVQFAAAGLEYVVVKTALIKNYSVSLRTLDSVDLWVRGKGNVFVAFEHAKVDSFFKAWKFDSLTANWKRLRIRPQDFDSAGGPIGNVGWMPVRDSITHLTFIGTAGTDLWLDDIRLHGIGPDDLR